MATQWEYYWLEIGYTANSDEVMQEVQALGDEGWEMVGWSPYRVDHSGGQTVEDHESFWFKRPKE
jgi:hypothetical protein